MKITLTDKGTLIARDRGTITRKGYVRLKDSEHRDRYEHREIQAKARRKPRPDQDVEHRNRLPADNPPSNLRNVRHDRHPAATRAKTR